METSTGQSLIYPQNYGFNFGTWLVHDPLTATPGDGPFFVNRKTKFGSLHDGVSNTLGTIDGGEVVDDRY